LKKQKQKRKAGRKNKKCKRLVQHPIRLKAGKATALSYQSPVVHVATPLAVYPASQENDTVPPSAVLRPTAVPPAMFAVVKPGEVVQRLSLVSVNTAATYMALQREEREK
jgi:hypothetical protein